MILVVSAWITAEESFSSLRELEELVAIHEELLDEISTDELEIVSADELDRITDDDCAESEDLDSSTALLSVFSGPEPLESSPQATRLTHAKRATTTKNFES